MFLQLSRNNRVTLFSFVLAYLQMSLSIQQLKTRYSPKSFLLQQKLLSIFALHFATMETLLSRITVNPDICHGKPTIRNSRYPVEFILDLLSSGMKNEEIISDYPTIELEDIRACLAFASLLTKVKSIHKIVA